MTDELGREELIEKLKVWKLGLSGYVWHNEDEQAYQQIKALIKKPGITEKEEIYKAFEKYNTQIQAILFLDPLDSKESYRKIDEATEVLHRRMEELIQQKPQVTKEWIHNYTKKWWIKYWKDLWDRDILHAVDAEKLKGTIRFNFKALKDFIRKIVEEIGK